VFSTRVFHKRQKEFAILNKAQVESCSIPTKRRGQLSIPAGKKRAINAKVYLVLEKAANTATLISKNHWKRARLHSCSLATFLDLEEEGIGQLRSLGRHGKQVTQPRNSTNLNGCFLARVPRTQPIAYEITLTELGVTTYDGVSDGICLHAILQLRPIESGT